MYMTLKDISVKKFIDLYDLQHATFFETKLDKETAMLSCLYDKPESFFLEMSMRELGKWSKGLNIISLDNIEPKPLRYIKANGKLYAPCYDFIKNVSGGQFLDSCKFCTPKETFIENLPKVLASFCLPVLGKTFFGTHKVGRYNIDVPHAEVAADMEHASIYDGYSIALFFWAVWKGSLEIMGHSLVRKIIQKKKETNSNLTKEEAEGLLHILEMCSGGTIR